MPPGRADDFRVRYPEIPFQEYLVNADRLSRWLRLGSKVLGANLGALVDDPC